MIQISFRSFLTNKGAYLITYTAQTSRALASMLGHMLGMSNTITNKIYQDANMYTIATMIYFADKSLSTNSVMFHDIDSMRIYKDTVNMTLEDMVCFAYIGSIRDSSIGYIDWVIDKYIEEIDKNKLFDLYSKATELNTWTPTDFIWIINNTNSKKHARFIADLVLERKQDKHVQDLVIGAQVLQGFGSGLANINMLLATE